MNAAHSRKQALDILRGIAVLMVAICHYAQLTGNTSPIFDAGQCGVDLFFVLSGFLISGLLFAEFRDTGTISLKHFWLRRAFKIYPPFYVLMLSVAVVALVRVHRLPKEIFFEAVFVQNYTPHIWPHTWSLAVEEHFYFSLPLILVLLVTIGKGKQNPFRLIPVLSVALSAICLYLRILAYRHGADWHHIAYPTHLRADALFAGVALGYYAHFEKASFLEARKNWVLAVGLALSLVLLVMPSVPRITFAYVAFSFIVAASANRSASRNWAAKTFAWIGYYSYSIYLWHVVALLLLLRMPATWWRIPAYFAVVIGFGVVMAKIVETPALRVRDRLVPSRLPRRSVQNSRPVEVQGGDVRQVETMSTEEPVKHDSLGDQIPIRTHS